MQPAFVSPRVCWTEQTFLASNASEVASLVKQIKNCDTCAGYLPLGTRPIFQLGPRAPILLVSQAPGRAAHFSGKPFDDPSGERLRRWLGVSSDSFYNPEHFSLLPMGFCYPGKGAGGDLPPRPECASRWRQRTLACMSNVQLTLLVGAHAVNWHLDKPRQNLGELVKEWRTRWPHTVVLPHPSPRNTYWLQQRPWVEASIVPALRQRVAALLGK